MARLNGHYATRLPRADLAATGAASDDRAARPRVPQAAARLALRGRREEVNGQMTCVHSVSTRRPIATRQSLFGEVAPLLRDEELARAPARAVDGARGRQVHDHLLESVFW